MHYWLMKSEPDVFGIEDLAGSPGGRTTWDGVRNYQARNFMRSMHKGDEALFYHSSCAEPGVVGRMRIVREAYPDPTQFDPADPHYDARSARSAPRWSAVDVEFIERFAKPVTLKLLRDDAALTGLTILRRGNRLSITPVLDGQWHRIIELSQCRDAR